MSFAIETQSDVGWCATSEKKDTVIALARDPALTIVRPTIPSKSELEMYGFVNVLESSFETCPFTLARRICINLELKVVQAFM